MYQHETTQTLSEEERKQMISLLKKHSKEDIEKALRQLANRKVV